ncbi:MAG: PTS transporter subunit EIIB [Cellulomonadaceae bacterium]|nr:PTS transporter subunit EIIB [Cellulomonadaceae bacterium]
MSKAEMILAGLGGAENITEYQPCITRIRVRVVDPEVIDEEALVNAGAYGTVVTGKTVQVIMGARAEEIGLEFEPLLTATA